MICVACISQSPSKSAREGREADALVDLVRALLVIELARRLLDEGIYELAHLLRKYFFTPLHTLRRATWLTCSLFNFRSYE